MLIAIKNMLHKIIRSLKAARHEWAFGGSVKGYIGKHSHQTFKISGVIGSDPFQLRKAALQPEGILPPYYGEEIYNNNGVSFKLRKHAIDKYGRVRYFDTIPDGYLDVMEHHRTYDSDNIINVFGRKKPKWVYAGFLEEGDQ